MKRYIILALSAVFGLLATPALAAAPFEITLPETVIFYQDIYEYKFSKGQMRALYTLAPAKTNTEANAEADNDVCYWNEESDLAINTASEIKKPAGEEIAWKLDSEKAHEFIREKIVPKVERDPENVRIFRDAEGTLLFEGAGVFGKKVDTEKLIALLDTAMIAGVNRIELPLIKIPPLVVVDDEELKNAGIKDLVSVGESDFTGSTWARMKNIEVGAAIFTGYLIPKGEIASFNTRLGNVTSAEGYVPELVIQGPKLVKELGGGLCQVSSTAFRAALLAGFPIVERYPHSFAVNYYEPWGTDAAIYIGHKDLRFQNDTEGAILVQTTMNRDTKTLRFHFYGTQDDRKVKFFGPANYGSMVATKGFSTKWFRIVESALAATSSEDPAAKESVYSFFSRYQPSTKWAIQKPAPAVAAPPEASPASSAAPAASTI